MISLQGSFENLNELTVFATGVFQPSSYALACLNLDLGPSQTFSMSESTFRVDCRAESLGTGELNFIYFRLPLTPETVVLSSSVFDAMGTLSSVGGDAYGMRVIIPDYVPGTFQWGGEIRTLGEVSGDNAYGIRFGGTNVNKKLRFESMRMEMGSTIIASDAEAGGIYFQGIDKVEFDQSSLVVTGLISSVNGAAVGLSLQIKDSLFKELTGTVSGSVTASDVAAGVEFRLGSSSDYIEDSSFFVKGTITGSFSYGGWCQFDLDGVENFILEVEAIVTGSQQAIGISLAESKGSNPPDLLPNVLKRTSFVVSGNIMGPTSTPSGSSQVTPRSFEPSVNVQTVGILLYSSELSEFYSFTCEVKGGVTGVAAMGIYFSFTPNSPNGDFLQGLKLLFTGEMEYIVDPGKPPPNGFVTFFTSEKVLLGSDDEDFLMVSTPSITTNPPTDPMIGVPIPALYVNVPENKEVRGGRFVGGGTLIKDAIRVSQPNFPMKNVDFLSNDGGRIKVLNSNPTDEWSSVTMTGPIDTALTLDLTQSPWCRVNLYHITTNLGWASMILFFVSLFFFFFFF